MELDELREQIDSIDEAIMNLLAKRFETTRAIGVIKSAQGLSSSSPEREAQQFRKLEVLAQERNLPHNLVSSIFRSVIDEVVVRHEALKNRERRNGGA